MSADVLVVDARGHRCPVPSLRLARALQGLAAGHRVELWASDPMARIDVPHMLRETPHRLEDISEDGGVLRISVVSGGPTG